MKCNVTAEAVCGTAVNTLHCYSHGWQDCETGVVALLAVDNSRAGLTILNEKQVYVSPLI